MKKNGTNKKKTILCSAVVFVLVLLMLVSCDALNIFKGLENGDTNNGTTDGTDDIDYSLILGVWEGEMVYHVSNGLMTVISWEFKNDGT